MTCVCPVGLDRIAVPGGTPAETIAAIIADEAAIGMMNKRTTAARIMPAPGKRVGDLVEFGGLLGRAPIMAVNPFSSARLVRRGRRIPASLQACNKCIAAVVGERQSTSVSHGSPPEQRKPPAGVYRAGVRRTSSAAYPVGENGEADKRDPCSMHDAIAVVGSNINCALHSGFTWTL